MEDVLQWKTTFGGEATSKQGRRFGMLTVLTNIRSIKVLWLVEDALQWLGVVITIEAGVQLLSRMGVFMGGWVDKTKVILNSTQLQLKLKLSLQNYLKIVQYL